MRVTLLEVEGYKGIRAVAFKPSEGVTEISGRNGAGKSSLLESIAVWLDGLDSAPAEPIRKDALRSKIRGRLGEMYVTRIIERKKDGKGHTSKILFEAVEGKPYPGTQKQLDDLIGQHNLDPLDFLSLDKKGKFDALKVFVPGFDFAKAAHEDEADRERRKLVNKTAGEARAAANLVDVPVDTPAELIDEQALLDKLQQAGDQNAETETRRARRQKVSDEVAAHRARSDSRAADKEEYSRQRLNLCQERVSELQSQIDRLQAQIAGEQAKARSDIESSHERIEADANAALQEAESKEAKLESAGPLPEVIDTVAIRREIEAARVTNAAVRRLIDRQKHLNTAATYEAESEALNISIKAREKAKRDAIAAAALPIPGIDFGNGEILLHNVPFEQASTAQKLGAAVAYTVARNPKLRLVWVKDASLLDDTMYAEVVKLSKEFNCDIYLETVRSIGKDAIVLEDGRLKEKEEAERTEAVPA